MSLLGELSYALIQPSARAIGTIFADVTVEENHRDEVIITQHPVEGGGVITDHAYKRPSELEIRCGFSNSSAGSVGYVQQQYQALLALQLARQPFDVYTGKRAYRNMLIRGLSVVTDPHSENILMASVALQEIVIVSTQTTSGSPANTATPNPDPSQQASPATTGSVTNGGSIETQGVGTQAFAGAYNAGTSSAVGPGGYNLDGSLATPQQGSGLTPPGLGAGLNSTPIDPGSAGGVLNPTPAITGGVPQLPVGIAPVSLDGISAPAPVTLTPFSPAPIGGLQGAGPDQYNMFGGGP